MCKETNMRFLSYLRSGRIKSFSDQSRVALSRKFHQRAVPEEETTLHFRGKIYRMKARNTFYRTQPVYLKQVHFRTARILKENAA